jgi:saccharopine dehydrogenase-like NADP-dependent oxidoreductase
MDAETEYDDLERIALLSAGLAPGIEHVAAIVEVKEVGLGGAHRLEILEHVPQFSINSLKFVTLFKPA